MLPSIVEPWSSQTGAISNSNTPAGATDGQKHPLMRPRPTKSAGPSGSFGLMPNTCSFFLKTERTSIFFKNGGFDHWQSPPTPVIVSPNETSLPLDKVAKSDPVSDLRVF